MTITPYLLYEDVDAALGFLARALGFEEVLRHSGPQATSTTPRCGSATT